VTYHQVELPDHVKYAYQALALHELREYFAPVFWSKKNVGQILEQVWFAGAHADVGGGYDDRRVLPLADIALMWMQHKAYNADSTTQRLKIPVGAGISKQTPSPKQYQPHNTIKGWFRWSTPTSRHLFRDEYANDALGGVWETIKLHQSVQQYWGNTTARDYEYSIKAVNKQLRKIDDRSLQFHLEQFSKYGIGFATD
jgi:hypothetical protein